MEYDNLWDDIKVKAKSARKVYKKNKEMLREELKMIGLKLDETFPVAHVTDSKGNSYVIVCTDYFCEKN